MPELEKLIALSRLFGIPLGALLGIEEEKKEGSADGETLSERELAAVEEIVGRYDFRAGEENTAAPAQEVAACLSGFGGRIFGLGGAGTI